MECKFKKPDGSCEIFGLVSIKGYNKVEISNDGIKLDGSPVKNVTEINIKATEDGNTTVTLKFDADVSMNLADECCSQERQ